MMDMMIVWSLVFGLWSLDFGTLYLGLLDPSCLLRLRYLRTHRLPAPVAPDKLINETVNDFLTFDLNSNPSGQCCTIAAQCHFQILEIPLFDRSIALDRLQVFGLPLTLAVAGRSHVIIGEDVIQLALVGVDVGNCPLIFDISKV